MSCCQPKESNQRTSKISCPECGQEGGKIGHITLENHLLPDIKGQIESDAIYKFCKNPNCDVVYFSSLKSIFFKHNLKEKVTIKDDDLDVKTCYCFNVTRGDIANEISATGNCGVIEIIKVKMKDPGCFCETSNPQGGCCLANNIANIKETKDKYKKGKLNDE
jgi:hypothetical protein